MDKVKVLKKCAEEAWFLYQACLRMVKAIEFDENVDESLKKLNSKIANVELGIEAIVDSGMLSHESIESAMLVKYEDYRKNLEKGE